MNNDNQPARRCWSEDEMSAEIRDYIVRTYGHPKDADDKDAYYTRLGMMIDFAAQLFRGSI